MTMTDKQIIESIDGVITDLVDGMGESQETKDNTKSSFIRLIGLVAKKYEDSEQFKAILDDYCALHEKQ